MPDQITVSEFIAETTEDYNSPTTSSFTTRLQNCRNTVTLLEEVKRFIHSPNCFLWFCFGFFIFLFVCLFVCFSFLRASGMGQYRQPQIRGSYRLWYACNLVF